MIIITRYPNPIYACQYSVQKTDYYIPPDLEKTILLDHPIPDSEDSKGFEGCKYATAVL